MRTKQRHDTEDDARILAALRDSPGLNLARVERIVGVRHGSLSATMARLVERGEVVNDGVANWRGDITRPRYRVGPPPKEPPP